MLQRAPGGGIELTGVARAARKPTSLSGKWQKSGTIRSAIGATGS
jgi:hypothetical protein